MIPKARPPDTGRGGVSRRGDPGGVGVGGEAKGDLLRGVLLGGEGREGVEGEPADADGLGVGLEVAAEGAAEHEGLADVPGRGADVAAVPIVQGDEADELGLQARFLAHFLEGVVGDAPIDVDPAAGERPATVVLVHQQDASGVVEERGTGVQLGRLEAHLVAEEVLDALRRQVCALGHHLGGDVADALEALAVKGVLGVGQARLREELQLLRPDQPLWLLGTFHANPPFCLGRRQPATLRPVGPTRLLSNIRTSEVNHPGSGLRGGDSK